MNGYWTLFGRCISVNETLYLGTLSRAGGLLMGAAFAMIWRPMALIRGPARTKGRQLDVLAVLGLAGLGLLVRNISLSGDGARPASASTRGCSVAASSSPDWRRCW